MANTEISNLCLEKLCLTKISLASSSVIVGAQYDLNVGFDGSSAASLSVPRTLQYAVEGNPVL
eukprot:8451767-Ditylum_brightwellii.AAC.1